MNASFISQQDRILVMAIELISESGLSALTLKGLANKGNFQEAVIYKHFGGIDEVLIAVVEFFAKFDRSIMDTLRLKDSDTPNKILDFFDAFATYYGNYKEISAVILHYEELLHNVGTRELISQCIEERSRFLTGLIQDGIDAGELRDDMVAADLADALISIMNGMIQSRRVMYREEDFKEQLMKVVNRILQWAAK